jgi:glycosyltransferase involved in cell wall biosynthesis
MAHVDVFIPCYNYGHFLRACVRSVLTQEHVEVRVLIIDDASSDHSAAVAKELAAQDERVLFRRHLSNWGHSATYNEGFDWATADYQILLSADDLMIPGALHRAVCLLETHPEVGMCYGRQILFRHDPRLPETACVSSDSNARIFSSGEFLEMLCIAGHNPVAMPTVVRRTELQKKLGYCREELPHTGDLEMWLRFGAHAAVGYLEAHQAFKRMHGRNMQLEFLAAPLGDILQRKAAFDIFFRDHGPVVADAKRLSQMATSSLAREVFWIASQAFDQGKVRDCQEFLTVALDWDPSLRSSPEWSRLGWKQFIGPILWRTAKPLIECLRRMPRAHRAQGATCLAEGLNG